MLILRSQNTAALRTIYFRADNTADDSPYTGTLTGADIKISKAGGAEASSLGTATHIASGLFKYVFDLTEIDTYGALSVRLAKTGVYPDAVVVQVVAVDVTDPNSLGLAYLDGPITSRLADEDYHAPSTLLTEASGVETGLTMQGALRIILAAVAGRRSGISTTTELYRDFGNTKTRLTMTFDASSNTTAVTYDAS